MSGYDEEAGKGLITTSSGVRRPDVETMQKEWDTASKLAVARDRTRCEMCTGVLAGLFFALLVAAVLIVVDQVDKTRSLGALEIALGTVAALALLISVPLLYSPGMPPASKVPRATPVSIMGATAEGQTLPYRSTRVDSLVHSVRYSHGEATTLREMWDFVCSDFGSRPCFGWRECMEVFEVGKLVTAPDGSKKDKRFRRKVLSNRFSFMTYKEADARVRKISRAVHAAAGTGNNVAIYAATRVEWQLTAQGCFRAGTPLATVYSTLGKDGLAYAANLTDSRVLFVEADTLKTAAQVACDGAEVNYGDGRVETMDLSSVSLFVLLDDESTPGVDAADLEALRSRSDERGGPAEVLTFADFEERGAEADADPDAPGPDSTAVIMFTSGSTGVPKGVVVLHRNLVATCAGLGGSLPDLTPDDTWLAYLPSSHILELAAELSFISAGSSLGFGSPFTLLASSPTIPQPGDIDTRGERRKAEVIGDFAALKPTVIAAVPAVVARIRKGLLAQVEAMSTTRRLLIKTALSSAASAYEAGRTTPFFDGLVMDTLRKRVLGGRVRMIASGGGPLSAENQIFMNIVMRCPMRQGYGLTETCGGGTLQWADDATTLRVGPPIPCCDIKLVDWADGGYTTTSNPPCGEICISGGNVTKGYYKEPAKTAEAFVEEEGRIWFHTGDIGQFDADGVLRIVDRKKDLVKLERGEYISLGKMESTFASVDGIANIICYGKSTADYSVCLVIVDETALPDDLKRESERAYVGDAAIADHILRLVKAKAKETKFSNKGEIPSKAYIVGSTAWLPPSGLVTASMKLQRKKIDKYYAAAYDFLYGTGTDPKDAIAADVPAKV